MRNNFLRIKIKAQRLSNLKVLYSSSKFPIVSNSNFRTFKPPPMSNSNFKPPSMSNSNFKPPSMSNNKFKPPTISNSNFKPSNSNFKPPMSNSNFRPPPLSNSNFRPPPISNSNFRPPPMSNSNFRPPPMSNSNFKPSPMSNSNFKSSPMSSPNRNKYDKYELSKFHRFSNKNKLNKPSNNMNKPDNKYNNNNFRSNIYFPVTRDNKKLNKTDDNDNNDFRKSNIYSAVMRDNIKVIKKEEKEEQTEVDDLSLFEDTGYTSYVTDLPEIFEETENVVENDEKVIESGDGVVVENSENSKNSSSKKKRKSHISPKLNKDEIQIVMEGYKDYYNKNYCQINFALLEDFPSWLNGLGLKPLAPYFEGLGWREIIEFSWHDLETSGITNWHLRKRLLRHFYSVRKFLAKERKIRLPAIDFSNLALVKGENDLEEDWYGHIDMGVLNDTECFLHSLGDGLGKLVPYFYGMKWQDLCQLSFRDLLVLRIDNTGTRNGNKKGKTKPRFDAMKLIEDAEISLRHSLINKGMNSIIKDKKFRYQDF
ncbi:3250_t:CDS:2 [Diversispora eburnea]|uniref:3250_t:CDS:1 n=1 Tax=Diversispora eburnea TaxID=1213867 RepID=A0A9N8YMT1_9GLOM|nr:3250_t:CDS:2 [Diversispora eburnea]